MIDLRCKKCRKLLLRAEDIRSGKIELRCRSCGTKNTYCFSPESRRKLAWFGQMQMKADTNRL